MKKLFNLKIADSESVARNLNEFNTLTNQLDSVDIKFESEIRAQVLLSSLSEAGRSRDGGEQFLWDRNVKV